MKRAVDAGIVSITARDIRDFARDRHRSTDDTPYGGGAGMVMRPGPIFECVEDIPVTDASKIVLMTPQGRTFNQTIAAELSRAEHLVLICGRYEGFDERVRTELATDEISIGDYVLTGGELPALVIIDAVLRLLPNVLGSQMSAENDSFSDDLLEYPQYTRPVEYRRARVPDVLLSGNHAEIANWRRKEQFRRTQERRPDLWAKFNPSKSDLKLLKQLLEEKHASHSEAEEKKTNASVDSGN